MSCAPDAGLPNALSENTRIYLRPLGLAGGAAGRCLVERAGGRWLAGGPSAFAACAVTWRDGGGRQHRVAALHEIESWISELGPGAGESVAGRLAALTAPRLAPGGGPFERPLIMAVVNATPDSFSDGGEFLDPATAIAHGRQLAAEGADILDIGGESVRPGAEPVVPALEAARVGPVLDGLKTAGPRLSIDTRNAEVMARALSVGATIINDVSALTSDPDSLATAAAGGASVVLMHMQGDPATMNREPAYQDVVLDVFDFLEARVAACLAAGIPRERIIVDPGIGFGKKSAHNLAILRALALYQGLGCPVMVGVSRKGLTGALDRAREPKDRLPGSLAAALWALDQGMQILRVHDVAETHQAVDVWYGLNKQVN